VPKTARTRTLASLVQEAEASEFKSILIYSGVGLLVSLTIVLARMNGIF